MGHMLIDAVRASDDCQLTGALDIAASPALGQDAGAYAGFATGVMVSADLHAGPTRVFVQGIAGYARGVGAGKGPVDETGIDLLQGFGEASLNVRDAHRITLRGGRMLIGLGSERLVGTRYGPNIPQPFDGVQVIAQIGHHMGRRR